jgi:NitT/TauT family transport system permease protein
VVQVSVVADESMSRAEKPPAAGQAEKERAQVRPTMWAIRGSLDRRIYLLIAISSFVLWVFAWWTITALNWVDPMFLPGPGAVLRRFVGWLYDGDLLKDTAISSFRVLAGFLLSAVMALPLGLLIGAYRPLRAFFEPLLEFARYLPAVAFVPLVLLWVGIGEGSKITLIWVGTFFQMVIMLSEDVARVPMPQVEAALTLGAAGREVLSQVLLRSALPAMFDTLRLTLGWAWTYLVVAELVAANSGLGYAILRAQRFLETDRIFVGIIVIGVVGLATDQLLRWAHRRLFPWARERST